MNPLDERVLADIRALASSLRPDSGGDEAFWNTLSEKHAGLIETFGFENFKRTVNFEYSQWGVSSFRDPKIRCLIRSLLLKGRLPWGGLRPSYASGDLGVVRWPDQIDARTAGSAGHPGFGGRLRLAAYAFFCGLLWQYARGEDRLQILARVEEPRVGNPLPLYQGRGLVSQDLALGAIELNRIAAHVPLDRVHRVLEIGAGYGRMAYLFRVLFPHIEYSILDVPPALAISRNYLAQVFGEDSVSGYNLEEPSPPRAGHIRFLTPGTLSAVPEGYFDLVLNISSFDEMSPATVQGYFAALEKAGRGWMYLKGYGRSRSAGHRLGVLEFPVNAHWRDLYVGTDPVVPGFVERILEKIPAPSIKTSSTRISPAQ